MKKIFIRQAKKEDVPLFEELFLIFSGGALHRNETIQKIIDDPRHELLIAKNDQEIVGFIHQVFFLDPVHAGYNSLITSLFIKKGYQRKRIGSQLVEKAIINARKRCAIEIHVDTKEDNFRAITFYQKQGFKKTGILFELNP